MYSSATPSTVVRVATPRTRSDFAASGVVPPSKVSATFGRAASARTLGAFVAVHTTMRSPVQ
jgi:hypothetical protein